MVLETILALLCIVFFVILMVVKKHNQSLESALIRLHGELDELGRKVIFYKGENEVMEKEIGEVRLANKVLKAKLSRKNCTRKKKVETPPLVKK